MEVALWQTHSTLNSLFRKLLSKVSSPQQAVLKHQLEKVYKGFLKTSQFFYKGYVQRLCARYEMPELERVARGAQLSGMTVPAQDRIDAVAAGIGDSLVSSCHLTLTYMGDLSRYRSLYLPHGRNFGICLTYYSLANDLIPDSGYGYHQMGLVFLEEKKHVEIVYHFYRALAAVKPHPNASSNLEVEFREVLRRDPPRARNPYDAFTFWFVRLHAYYHRGEHFSQRTELEEEVLHRFKVALKANDFSPTLLKMVLINICAYQIAQDKIKGNILLPVAPSYYFDYSNFFIAEWTAVGSQACQFILGFNIRMIHVVASFLKTEILDLINDQRDVIPGDTPRKFSAMVDAGLPLFRVYMTWLCAYSSDVVKFQAHLEPHVGEMYNALSQALSGLLELIADSEISNMPEPYLLPEDIQTLGLRCLSGGDFPAACRLCVDPIKHTQKPLVEELGGESGLDIKPDDTSFARALGIAACALTLARDPAFPTTASTVAKGDSTLVQFDYLADGKSPGNDYTNFAEPITPSTAVGSLLATLGNPHAPPMPAAAESAHYNPSSLNASDEQPAPRGLPAAAFRQDPTPTYGQAPRQTTGDPESVMERQLSDLVNSLLGPSKSSPQETPAPPDETSYGMHTNTAVEVFGPGATAVSPGPGSATKKSFPNLPWNYFFTPTPKPSGLADRSPRDAWNNTPSMDASPFGNLANNMNAHGEEFTSDPFSRQLRNRGQATAAVSSEHYTSGNPVSAFHSPAQNLFNSPDAANPWNGDMGLDGLVAGPMLGQSGNAGRSRPASSRGGNHMPGSMPPMHSPFLSTAFSGNTSSLPPVNSPWGLPANAQVNAGNATGLASSDMMSHGQYPTTAFQSSSANPGLAYQNDSWYDPASLARAGQVSALGGPNCALDPSWALQGAGEDSDDDAAFFNPSAQNSKTKR